MFKKIGSKDNEKINVRGLAFPFFRNGVHGSGNQ